jgi:hypothetical protein
MINTDNLDKLFEDLKNGHYEDVDIYLTKALTEYNSLQSADFWSNWVYPDGATPEQIQNELDDFHMVIGNVSKVYDHITKGRISKPNTLAEEVISVADDIVTELIMDEINEERE